MCATATCRILGTVPRPLEYDADNKMHDTLSRNPIFLDRVPVQQKPKICKADVMTEVSVVIDDIVTAMKDGQMAVASSFMNQFEGKDMWASCSALIAQSTVPRRETITYQEDGCTAEFPATCVTEDGSGRESQQPVEDYCKFNPKHPWCKNPCCNWKKGETMCCRPKQVEREVNMPEIDPEKLGKRCPGFAKGGSVADAVAASNEFARATGAGATCLMDQAVVTKRDTALDVAGDCCFYAVTGTQGGFGGEGNKKKGSQLCNFHSDCDSGVCVLSSKDTPTVPEYASKKCYLKKNDPRLTGKSGVCKVPSTMEDMGQTLVRCLAREFKRNAENLSLPQLNKATALLNELLGLTWDTKQSQVATKLFNQVWVVCSYTGVVPVVFYRSGPLYCYVLCGRVSTGMPLP